jgi:hypothetical protein
MSESDLRLTPQWLLDVARDLFRGHIGFDPCNHPSNPTQAQAFLCSEDGDDGKVSRWNHRAWCNMPYSDIRPWAEKAVRESRSGTDAILLLTPDDCRTKWYSFLIDNTDAHCRIRRGVGFLRPADGGGFEPLPGPRWGSCVWFLGTERRRFSRVFGAIGNVTHGLGPQEEAE